MPRAKTPSFIAEVPLRTSAADEHVLAIRLNSHRHLYNACLGEALRRLALMRQSKTWQQARAMPKGTPRSETRKARAAAFKVAMAAFGFTSASIQTYAETCRDACWIGDHAGSHDTQTTSLRAFRAVQQYAFGTRGRPRFKGYARLNSVEGKGDAVIRFRRDPVPAVHWSGLVLPVRLDPKDTRHWQKRALECRTKYVRVLRRFVRGRLRWYAQLVQEGIAPQVREAVVGVVGLDIGPSTIAAVSDQDAMLERFCPTITQPWRALRRIERAMDRSRRATNTDNFDAKGRAKTGKKSWTRSRRYLRLAQKRRERERRLAADRKRAHGELANRILGQGTTIKTEKLSYRSFQKNFGRSTKVRAPSMLVSLLRRKAASAGGVMIEINTRTTRLSQFDHTTGHYVKKPLRQRTHVFGDGVTEPVQRDLYSAFLVRCCDANTLDISQVHGAWPAAEPLLRRAVSSGLQPASRWGFALPPIRWGGGAGRPSKGDGRLVEAVDGVAQARATERSDAATLRTPWL